MSCCKENKFEAFTKHSLVKAAESIIKHMMSPHYDAFVGEETKIERMKICDDCEMKEKILGKKRCKVCSCFLEAKASLAEQDCPHPGGSKWHARTSQKSL